MNKPATIVTTILITLAILAGISGALHVAWIMDACEMANAGQRCTLTAVREAKP